MLFGLGWPQWLTIILLVGGLLLTFKMMAKASVRYEAARKAREARELEEREGREPHEDRHPS
jgi:predicted DNA repair protein MutK